MAAKKPIIAAVVALPPPVTGMTVVNQHMVEQLRTSADVRAIDCSGGARQRGLNRAVRRAWKYLQASVRLVSLRLAGCKQLYTTANSTGGLWFDMLLLSVARLLGIRTTMHHHVYAYVHEADSRMRLVDRLLGEQGTHVFLCEGMSRSFARQYGSRAKHRVIHNPIAIAELAKAPERVEFSESRPLRLGHLSNLTYEKGLDVVIQTVQAAREQGLPVALELAGPAANDQAQQLIDDALAASPTIVTHVGPVYDQQKADYLKRIDVLLFPTCYANEAQPLVLLEAMASGKPVVAFDRGCIASMLNAPGGHAIDRNANFVAFAEKLISNWIDSPSDYLSASQHARKLASDWQQASERDVAAFVECMTSEVNAQSGAISTAEVPTL